MSLLHGWRASTKVLKLGFASIGVQIRSFSVRNPLPLSDLQNSAVDDKADPFYVVRKGSHVGIFSSLDDCQAQVSPSVLGPPVSVFKGYSLSKETEEYLASCGLKNALYSINSKDLKEDLFGTLVPCPFQQPIGAATLLDEIAELSTHNIFTESLNSTGSCILEFDGASKIKTRKAGAGAILRTKEGDVICRLREGLSFTTNNAAEYKALILGMKHALKKGFTQVHVQGDSQLVCMQVQGTWKTKNRNLAVLYDEAKTLKKKFASLTICHVERAVYFTDDEESTEKLFHDKTLGAALDSFDYLFCRRCLVFDCRLHGCS